MYRIQEFPEVMADACLRDSEGRFVFLSLYGRDTAALQFVSAMQLPRAEQGIETFHLVDAEGRAAPVEVGGADRLAKHTGRLPKHNIFGPLSQLWIYDAGVQRPDPVNRQGWVLHQLSGEVQADDMLLTKAWRLMQQLSPVPLLEPWRAPLMDIALKAGMVRLLDDPLYPPLGPVRGARVSLGTQFLDRVAEMVAAGTLGLPAELHT